MTSRTDLPGARGWVVSRITWAEAMALPVPSHPLAEAVAAASAGLTAALQAPVWSLGAGDVGDVLDQLHRLTSTVAAAQLKVLTHAADLEIQTENGAPTTAAWLAQRTRQTRQAAARQVRLAAELDTCPTVADAFARGAIGTDAAAVITAAIAALPTDTVPADVRADAEATLVELAGRHDPHELKVLGRRVLDIVAPEIGEAEEARQLAAEESAAAKKTRLSCAIAATAPPTAGSPFPRLSQTCSAST